DENVKASGEGMDNKDAQRKRLIRIREMMEAKEQHDFKEA
ncbi:931_t:CDS:1, partial [Cetraspora pellucida]